MDEAHAIGMHQDCGGLVMGRPIGDPPDIIGQLVPTTYFSPVRVVFWCGRCDQSARDVRLTFGDGEVKAVAMIGPAGETL